MIAIGDLPETVASPAQNAARCHLSFSGWNEHRQADSRKCGAGSGRLLQGVNSRLYLVLALQEEAQVAVGMPVSHAATAVWQEVASLRVEARGPRAGRDPDWSALAAGLRSSHPGLVSLRHAGGPATGLLIRAGKDLLLSCGLSVLAAPAPSP